MTARPSRRRRAVDKRDGAPAPHVKTLLEAKGSNYPPGRMLIASPRAVQEEVSAVPAGRVLSLSALRAQLAQRFDADYTCPITTGIFLRIVADAACEEGRADAVPVWRVVRDDGACLDTPQGDAPRQAGRLQAEGVTMMRRGSRWYVLDMAAVHLMTVPVGSYLTPPR